MNNYNAMGKLLEFSITSIGYCFLREAWAHKLVLNGSFFRLYWQSDEGAGVIINKKKHYLLTNCFYLIPPNCNLPTFCDNPDVSQIFIHFTFGQYCCAPLLTAIPATDELLKYAQNIRDGFLCEPQQESVTRHLNAFALCAGAVAALPEGIFSVRPKMVGMDRVCSVMEENPAASLNVPELARIAGLSTAEFTRQFKEATGQPPYAYLNTLRYETAAAMLTGSSSSIEEICEATGIHDRFHFSRCFKKRYGHPPAAYRKLMQAQEQQEKQ